MPRSVDITLPPDRTDRFVADAKTLDGLIGMRIQRGVSAQPSGDLIYIYRQQIDR